MKAKFRFWYGIFALSIICVVLMNVFSIPGHDESCCAFMGQSTPSAGDCPRVSSLMDIVRQQCQDYVNANGRFFVHVLVAFFAGFRLYYLFDIINSFVWFAFVFLILKESNVEINMKRFVVGSLLVFVFWWYSETVCMNADFAIDYLWMATATLLIMRLWKDMNSWLWLPVGFIYGWGQETYSLPMMATLVSSVIINWVKERRYVATGKQTAFIVSMIAGCIGLVMSPGIRARAGNALSISVWQYLIVILKWIANLAFGVWPMVLFVGVMCLLLKKRKTLVSYLCEDLEWWMFFVASFGLCIVTRGGYRVCSAWIMAGIILLLRDVKSQFLDKRGVLVFAFVALAWMIIGTLLQISYGLNNFKMLDMYKADEQGITYRKVVPPTFWNNMCSVGIYCPFHLNIFRLNCQKKISPIILSKQLYETLYETPAKFFSMSSKEGDVYYCSKFYGLAVKIGRTDFTQEERLSLRARMARKGWRRLLPGRLRKMFPSEVEYVNLPSCDSTVSFIAKDGNWYTIYTFLHDQN